MNINIIIQGLSHFPWVLTIILYGCLTPPEETSDTTIYLEAQSVEVTVAALKVGVSDTNAVWNYSLTRGDSIISAATVFASDTVITDIGLLPAHAYQYRARLIGDGDTIDSSDVLAVSTMDTTSFTFTWEVDTFGIYGTEILDVAVLAEDDIRAVGRIWFDDPDSSFNGTGREYFNLARFNGSEWAFSRVGYDPWPGITYAICVINENDIWYSIGGDPVHWDGVEHTLFYSSISPGIPPGIRVFRIWANSSDDVYFVGYGGAFFRYNGQDFETIETDTYINLVDIVGTQGSDDIFIRGYKNPGSGDPPGCTILHYSRVSGNVQRLYYAEYPNTQGEYGWVLGFGLGSQSNIVLISTDDGILEINTETGTSALTRSRVCKIGRSYYPEGPGQVRNILYTAPNDIFFAGIQFKNVYHNGYSYTVYSEIDNLFPHIRVENSEQLGNLYVVAGYEAGWAYGAISRIWKN